MIDEAAIRDRFEAMRVRLDERERRLFAAAEARSAGYGGVSAVARATEIARSTIDRGLKDLAAPDRAGSKVRRSGGGRPALTRADPTLLEDLRGLLESTTLGDPTRPLIWVSKSHAKLALALEGLGHRVSATRIRNCSNASAIVARSIARAWRAAIMSTGTLSSNTSTRRLKPFRPPASR